jgi:hypothetical protein
LNIISATVLPGPARFLTQPDPILFASNPVSGSASGSPATRGYIANVSWWPQQNIELAAQYTGYTRFNGTGTNYDGFGRKASANNSTYLVVFFVF